MIEINGLSKQYNKVIFDNFDMDIDEGQFVLISGESGRGKSTLLNIIGMLDTDYEGSVCVLGYEQLQIDSKVGRRLLNNDISYLFQNFGLIDNKTIYENLVIISKVKKYKKKQRVSLMKEALEKVKLDMDINTPIYELSGGEQQRVAVAKIILKAPKLILCDEPTGSLDQDNAHAIMTILSELNKQGSTIVIASHDPLVKQYVTNIIEL